jgi:hypothetical protein
MCVAAVHDQELKQKCFGRSTLRAVAMFVRYDRPGA